MYTSLSYTHHNHPNITSAIFTGRLYSEFSATQLIVTGNPSQTAIVYEPLTEMIQQTKYGRRKQLLSPS